jgi:phosphoesterase RecJ-like protein
VQLKKLVAALKEKNNFLITTHVNLEGDALGSELAFYRLLKALGKRAIVLNDDIIPYGYEFLSDTRLIRRFDRRMRGLKFDCLAALDCSDLGRCGAIANLDLRDKFVINIDHHISNQKFGDINWVKPQASSTSEMIYRLYKKMGIAFDKNVATLLYAGMLTDTGSFRYSNTSAFTHQAIADLVSHGLNVRQIYNNIYENIPFSDMQLLAEILPRMRRFAGGKVVWFAIPRNMWKGKKIFFDLSEHILSFGRSIKDVEVVVLFKENLGQRQEVRVNLRSHGKVDVNALAHLFGGGGHRTASGCTIPGKIENAKRQVLSKIKAAIDKI